MAIADRQGIFDQGDDNDPGAPPLKRCVLCLTRKVHTHAWRPVCLDCRATEAKRNASAASAIDSASAGRIPRGAFPISRSRAHTHRRHGHPLQTVPSAGLIERPQEKNRVDALR